MMRGGGAENGGRKVGSRRLRTESEVWRAVDRTDQRRSHWTPIRPLPSGFRLSSISICYPLSKPLIIRHPALIIHDSPIEPKSGLRIESKGLIQS